MTRRLLLPLSLAVNLALLGAGLWLWSGLAARSLLGQFVEPARERQLSQFEVLPVRPGSVVFLGDSITAGGSWHELFPHTPVHNRGIGGDTAAGVLARIAQVTDGRPAAVFLMIGTNDLFIGRAPAAIAQKVEAIVTAIASTSPGTQVYLQSVLPRAAEYRDRVVALNRALEAVTERTASVWVNLYPYMLDVSDGSIRNDYSNDELHLTGRGYLAWRAQIDPLVRSHR